MFKYIKTFKQLTKTDVKIAGGKGASLGEMTKAGIPVPPGFVILSSGYEYFTNFAPRTAAAEADYDIQAQLDKINYQDINSIDRASNVIRDILDDTQAPEGLAKEIFKEFSGLGVKYVAVRSSATAEDSSIASWAGELESYLNTTKKTLLDNIKRCWSSLYTPRAIFYRYEKKLLDQKVQVAVVVQKMVESVISGIAFTVHPVTKDTNQMIIEAGWGLGEAIVSGSITPDSYVVDKRDFSFIDINVSEQKKMIKRNGAGGGVAEISVPKSKQNQQVLAGKQIAELAKLCRKIEKHYKKPQDIEWAYEKGKFHIVQSRPITTL